MAEKSYALNLAIKIADEETSLTISEALHWIADSEEAADLYIEEVVNEAKAELANKYPKFVKNFWWKGKAKRWAQDT